MTIKQKILKAVYPLFVSVTRRTGRNARVLKNEGNVPPTQSFYDLSLTLNTGEPLSLSAYSGKKVLLVNTASNCGYTAQYDDLQQLYQQYRDQLVIIGFPANDFNEQEKGSDEEIAAFCRLNYGVTFPLSQKSRVIRTGDQNEVFRWLSDKKKNGWNDQPPVWNFSKYLVSETGVLTDYFGPSISPLSDLVIQAVVR